MIKANELRIGNWVEAEGKWYQIKHISLGDEWLPIPLTPEILEKAGFIKGEVNGGRDWVAYDSYSVNGLTLCVADGNIKIWEECEDGFFSYYYHDIKSVHQLQNLYFALTGTELEINL